MRNPEPAHITRQCGIRGNEPVPLSNPPFRARPTVVKKRVFALYRGRFQAVQ